MTKRLQPKASPPEPQVGIFWLLSGKLIFDCTPLSKAEPSAQYRDHPGSHIDTWAQWQQRGEAPREAEYEEFPRGRVVYDTTNERFTLFADKCILKEKRLVSEIKARMNLPAKSLVESDIHYRCAVCLYGNEFDDEDED